ncbi:MAG: zf-HC2 domain-containing protein [Acidobacteria bacterium]|nr:zf-HC2 domain-containing protein [Acidobacteriota bacterium]
MLINCEQVWREVSDYLDGEVDPELRRWQYRSGPIISG